ncbi:DUF2637 domain-containing protein [Streptomyces marokkonensis]|uniref:DUF2637 domain-containing protein n=1 Tax=Streptomyces marokkonensis TaxID=324855 RepID=A0ABW6QCP3_9ACTN
MHRVLIGVVVTGAVIIAGIGFAGSYAAVRDLAQHKGFGNFSYIFPIGIDAGICVLLALDLLLTWIRTPLPLLRQTAWLLTAATIAFNGAAAWPDPLGVGMHGVIPVLFVVCVEAARHAIGRIADITADKHMEGVRLTRWLLSPGPTFLLWRRMKLWELRSYEHVIKLEQERLVYQARLRSRYGRAWRRKAPIEALLPLRLTKYGIPLTHTHPADTQDPAALPQRTPAKTRNDGALAPGNTTALPRPQQPHHAPPRHRHPTAKPRRPEHPPATPKRIMPPRPTLPSPTTRHSHCSRSCTSVTGHSPHDHDRQIPRPTSSSTPLPAHGSPTDTKSGPSPTRTPSRLTAANATGSPARMASPSRQPNSRRMQPPYGPATAAPSQRALAPHRLLDSNQPPTAHPDSGVTSHRNHPTTPGNPPKGQHPANSRAGLPQDPLHV